MLQNIYFQPFVVVVVVVEAYRGGVEGWRYSKGGTENPNDSEDQENHQLRGARLQRRHDGPPPVQRHRQHRQHRGWDRAERDELVEGAIEGAEVPLSE